ncbi:MAG TPA: Na/Pi cotransporter family protein [Desulfitobacteriaceae bacterium]|jgi:phosphate:Na+ symporter|nr:Na/Pi cotransporter family protein [Desulfitobacteriaceae bacterium]
MFSVQITSGGLQRFAANKLRVILLSLTKRPFLAVVFGTFMTVAFQSSAATTVLVVEFVDVGLLSLAQSLGIVLGSAVGTSIVIQLISFKILNFALGCIFVGFILYFFVGKKQAKYLGQALIGFGIIFVGMNYMSEATAPLKNYPQVYTIITHLGVYPFAALIAGIILTSIAQNSTVVMAIIMSLAGQHLLPATAIVPLILGVHIGGTLTALFSSMVAQKMDAKRTALANTVYKAVTTILVFPFLAQFTWLIQSTSGDLQRQVANAHLLFAILMVILFLPLNSTFAKLLVRLLPSRPEHHPRLKLRFIDESSLEVPTVALSHAFKEVWYVGQFIYTKMVQAMPEAILAGNNEAANRVVQAEEDVDWFYNQISHLLTLLSLKGLTEEQIREKLNAQFILKEFEYIADKFVSMAGIALKIHREVLVIPPKDWDQLAELYAKIKDNFVRVLEALKQWNVELAVQAMREHREISRVQRALQIKTLTQGTCDNYANLDIRNEEKITYAKIDLINLFYGIDGHLMNITQVIMEVHGITEVHGVISDA